MSMVTVRIENAYACGRESWHTVEVEAPAITDSVEEWWEDVVYPHTGDGHPCGASEDANYEATIIDTTPDAAGLIGQRMEWG